MVDRESIGAVSFVYFMGFSQLFIPSFHYPLSYIGKDFKKDIDRFIEDKQLVRVSRITHAFDCLMPRHPFLLNTKISLHAISIIPDTDCE